MLERVVVLPLPISLRLDTVAVLPVLLSAIIVIPLTTIVLFVEAMTLWFALRLRNLTVGIRIDGRQRLLHRIPLRTVEVLLATLLRVILFL